MAFSGNKLIDLNLYYYILRHIIYSTNPDKVSYDEDQEDDEMTSIDILEKDIKANSHRAYQANFDNWVYFINSPESNVVIKKNGYVIDPSKYTINYENGIIYFTTTYARTLDDTDLITADYKFLTVKVFDGYPYHLKEAPEPQQKLPVVAVEYNDKVPNPFELGGTKEQVRSFSIHVCATCDSERDDISGVIEEELGQSISITDFREGLPLNADGTLNTGYTDVPLINQRIIFENIKSRVVRVDNPKPLEKFWSIITLTTRSFV